MTRYMVTGGKGRLGKAITARLQAEPANTVYSVDLDELDITDFAAVRHAVTKHEPQVVFHAAAWTDVDGCAKDPQRAIVANGLGAGNVAVATAEVGASIVYISSNEVFDGRKTDRNYYEYDTPNPINSYGYSKRVGEQEVARLNPCHMVVRTSWLFAHGGKNFMQAIINAAAAEKSLRVVTDEVANPTYNNDLAEAVIQLAATGRYGTYHLVNEGAVPRWDFARYILDRTGYADTSLGRITRADWPRPSTPPAYCGLENLAAKHLGVQLRPWQTAVDAFLSKERLLVDAD